MPDDLDDDASLKRIRRMFSRRGSVEQSPEVAEMRKNRAVNRRTATAVASTAGGGANMSFATGRPRDPLFYWKQNNLPWDIGDDEELAKVRAYCALLYLTHPLVASCIDIYTKFPLLGMELQCKDSKLADFYTDLFFAEDGLNYNEFLPQMGREFWLRGEAWPLGSWNDVLGIWDDEELLNPDDVKVTRSALLKESRYEIRLPENLRNVLKDRSPKWEYEQLITEYPELRNFMGDDDRMLVSNVLLKQIKFDADTFNKRGVPILMRAIRAIMQEEMMNAAVDAVAERLYTPLILVKLGATAQDLGTDTPWVPTEDDLETFSESLDAALAADFRVIIHHAFVSMESVFGRENMPDMTADFERLEDRILQSFGLSKTMLAGADGGETYAADALNRDLVSQLLTSYQNLIQKHFRQRALIVAEAQGHYDYEERDGRRIPIMEEILEIDEETGEERIVEQPKLLVPTIKFRTLNFSDEQQEHEFLEALRAAGVPISIKTRLTNTSIHFEDELETTRSESVQLAVAEQETRKEIYLALRAKGLPIPQELLEDFQPKVENAPVSNVDPNMRVPQLGLDPTTYTPNLAPGMQDTMLPTDATDGQMNAGALIGQDPMTPGVDDDPPSRPEESDEMRASMPKAGMLYNGALEMRKVLAIHEPIVTDLVYEGEFMLKSHQTPKHIGMRRYVKKADLS